MAKIKNTHTESCIVRDYYPNTRLRCTSFGKPRETSSTIVERPARSINKILARQQQTGVEQSYSRTIPTQHDEKFGKVDVLGTICQDGHQLMQDYLDASKPKPKTNPTKANVDEPTVAPSESDTVTE